MTKKRAVKDLIGGVLVGLGSILIAEGIKSGKKTIVKKEEPVAAESGELEAKEVSDHTEEDVADLIDLIEEEKPEE